MIIKEITPPIERVFEMELGEKELAAIRKALVLLIQKEDKEREQQQEHMYANMDPDTVLPILPPSEDRKIADHLISNIRHVERTGHPQLNRVL